MTAAMPSIPAAAAVRVALRRVRRGHSDRTLGDLLTDVYTFGFVVLLYGGAGAVSIRRHLAKPLAGPAGTAALRGWLVVALLVTVAALVWHLLRVLGPLVTAPAVQTWVLATPVDRASWLGPPLRLLLGIVAVAGTVAGLFAGWAGLSADGSGAGGTARTATAGEGGGTGWAWVAAPLAGAAAAVALAAGAVAVQPRPRTHGRRTVGLVLLIGLTLVAVVVVLRRSDASVPALAAPAWAVVAVLVAAAVLLIRRAVATLPRLDRAALGGGAQLANAAMTAVIMVDPVLLFGMIEAQRWRQAGRVHSRRLRPGSRTWVLLQADLIRLTRRRADAAAYAALALAPYATAVFAPLAVGPVRIVAAYLAVDRLAGGLRTVARSAALRRSLGGTDGELRMIHLIVPAAGLTMWWYATGWCGAPSPPLIALLVVLGVLGAVYRTATRPPMSYDADLADSPLGPVPTTLVRRLVRGPDVVAVLVLIDLFTSAGLRNTT